MGLCIQGLLFEGLDVLLEGFSLRGNFSNEFEDESLLTGRVLAFRCGRMFFALRRNEGLLESLLYGGRCARGNLFCRGLCVFKCIYLWRG